MKNQTKALLFIANAYFLIQAIEAEQLALSITLFFFAALIVPTPQKTK